MSANPFSPSLILSATNRIYLKFPTMIDNDDWIYLKPQVDSLIEQLEVDKSAYVTSKLFDLLESYPPLLKCLNDEIKIQGAISANISIPINNIAESLNVEIGTIDAMTASAFSILQWDVDRDTIPLTFEDTKLRRITLDAGTEKSESIKFKNMRIDLEDFVKISGGAIISGLEMVDKPNPIFIVAVILLTVLALRDTMKIELTEQDASVFWGIAKLIGNMRGAGVREETIIKITNEERKNNYGLPSLTDSQVQHSLVKLERIKSIKKKGESYFVIEDYTAKD